VGFVVIATWIAKPGYEDAVAKEIQGLIQPSRAEAGCLCYEAHRSLSDPRTFVLYERYVDEATYAAHTDSPHFKAHALQAGIPLLESRHRQFLASINAADER